jgi:two-component system OmpR family response regulator
MAMTTGNGAGFPSGVSPAGAGSPTGAGPTAGAGPTGASLATILVVDDEPSIVDTVATVLRYEGFEVFEATTGRQALSLVQERRFDLIVLDLMLPDFDGLSLTRRIRADGVSTPVLFLTARGEVSDLVSGLEAGADDYVAKPFSLAEVVARSKALVRRSKGLAPDDRLLRFADLTMDEETHSVWRGDVPVQLTATEFSLLRAFLLSPRRVLSKAQLIDYVWHYDFGGNHNIVETYVRYLRRKLDPLGPPLIHTIRLVGYVMRESEDEQ